MKNMKLSKWNSKTQNKRNNQIKCNKQNEIKWNNKTKN